MHNTYITETVDETQKLGETLASTLRGGEIISLTGELGAGKTTFVQGIARGLGITQRIISPTFILIREYDVNTEKTSIKRFYHIDLYRLENEKEIESLGLSEVFANRQAIVLIEWAEKLKEKLPKESTHITITAESETRRKIIIAHG